MTQPILQQSIYRDLDRTDSRINKLEQAVRGEFWHIVGATGEPAFQNSWANKGGTYEVAAYRKTSSGIVFFKGTITGGTLGSTVFTLPEEYRPALDRRVGAVVWNGASFAVGQITVHASTGNIQAEVPANNEVSLEFSYAI